jgi:hypothetical protein
MKMLRFYLVKKFVILVVSQVCPLRCESAGAVLGSDTGMDL